MDFIVDFVLLVFLCKNDELAAFTWACGLIFNLSSSPFGSTQERPEPHLKAGLAGFFLRGYISEKSWMVKVQVFLVLIKRDTQYVGKKSIFAPFSWQCLKWEPWDPEVWAKPTGPSAYKGANPQERNYINHVCISTHTAAWSDENHTGNACVSQLAFRAEVPPM